MKIGDKVRFLSETGGGKVIGFQKNNIVLVEDEDGFQIPFPKNEVVVIGSEDYSSTKFTMPTIKSKNGESEIELNQDNRSIKSKMEEGQEDMSFSFDDDFRFDKIDGIQNSYRRAPRGGSFKCLSCFCSNEYKTIYFFCI